MAYKPDVSDARESPAIDIAQLLEQRGAVISYSDPHVEEVQHGEYRKSGITPAEAYAAGIDCALITTNHKAFDYAEIVERSPVVVDTRNALKGVKSEHVFRL
jgi:UDP-N-acetyl-D-glucosamine dehydrogenase